MNAQMNAAEIARMSPQQHFQILSQTMARRSVTVQQAMDDTKRAQSNLERYVLQASRMTSEEFEQLTGQKKSANVAFAEINRVMAG